MRIMHIYIAYTYICVLYSLGCSKEQQQYVYIRIEKKNYFPLSRDYDDDDVVDMC